MEPSSAGWAVHTDVGTVVGDLIYLLTLPQQSVAARHIACALLERTTYGTDC